MPAAAIIEDAEQRMDKAIEVLKKSLSGIRTGRANPTTPGSSKKLKRQLLPATLASIPKTTVASSELTFRRSRLT